MTASVGVPGFRVGTGPRGNYVRTGASGVLYRTTSSSGASPRPVESTPNAFDSLDVHMSDVTGASALDLVPTGGDDIVEQLNRAARRIRWAWLATLLLGVIGLASLPWGIIAWALAVPCCTWLFLRDSSRRKVVLLYEVSDESATWFEELVQRWSWLMNSQKLWRTVASGEVNTPYQHKRNAGASALVQRVDAHASLQGPPHLATNVSVPSITAGDSSIHFLPDRLLVRNGKNYTDVSYRHLGVQSSRRNFIETSGQVPPDAIVVGTTWQYVNKDGGPDRRFSNNRQLPVVVYSDLSLTTGQGLQWLLQCSRASITQEISRSISNVPINEVS